MQINDIANFSKYDNLHFNHISIHTRSLKTLYFRYTVFCLNVICLFRICALFDYTL